MKNQSKLSNLGKIIVKEASTLIPFGCVSPKICYNWGVFSKKENPTVRDLKNKGTFLRRLVTNGGLSVFGTVYVVGALLQGANPLNPWDVSEKSKQYSEKIQLEKKARMNKVFTEIDKNKDYVIDVNEFSDYLEKYHSH